VTQVGIHRRSGKFLQEAARIVREGGIGHVTVARGYHLQNEWPKGIGNPPDEQPWDAEAWDKWLGPAPKVPYNKNRTFYNFRWFLNYSGGQLTNFGVHYMDMLRWCLGKESPKAVVAMGGKYVVEDNREIPDTLEVMWDFGGTMVHFVQYNANRAPGNAKNSEMELRGTKGTMYLWGNRWEIVPENVSDSPRPGRSPVDRQMEKNVGKIAPAMQASTMQGSADTAFHARNFLDCVKTRAKCNCDILDGHLSTSATLIGNIALRTKSYLEWDAKTEKFTNNAAANKWLHYEYRAPYKLG